MSSVLVSYDTSKMCNIAPCSCDVDKKRQKLKSGVLFLVYELGCDNGVLLTHRIPVRISVFTRGCEHYATVSRDVSNSVYVNLKNCVVAMASRDPKSLTFHITSPGTEDKRLTFEASNLSDLFAWTQVFSSRYRPLRKSASPIVHSSRAWSERRAHSLPTLSEEDES